MRLSRVFGISPEHAAQLEQANIRTVRHLADTTDLAALSARIDAPPELLELWRAAAQAKVAGSRRRRKAVAVLGAVTAVLLAAIAIWSHKKGISPRLDEAITYYNRGNDLSAKGDYNAAIAEYQKALALRPDDANAHNNLGIALDAKGDKDAAISEYRKALNLKPGYFDAHFNLGLALDTKGDYNAAIAEYQKALALKPDDANAHNNLGVALYDKGDYDAAIAEYRRALALEPDYTDAHNNLGVALYHKGDYDAAIAEYRRALALEPDYAMAHNNLGAALDYAGRYDDAIAEYGKALALKPDNATADMAFTNRGRAKFNLADFLEAAADLQNAHSLDSSDAYTLLWLHLARKNAGQDDAEDFARQASKIDSSKWPAPVANLFLGRLTPEQTLGAASNPDSIKAKEQHCEAEFYIGEYFLLREEKSKALVHLRRAHNICPHSFVEYGGAVAEMRRLGVKDEPRNKK